MGGRGQNYKIVDRLKNYNKAKITNSKLSYLLVRDKTKAKFFNNLGYTTKTKSKLQKDILNKLKTNKALKYDNDEFGNEIYQVNMQLGINNKMIVTTAWKIENGDDYPQFVTAYNNKKYNKKRRKN